MQEVSASVVAAQRGTVREVVSRGGVPGGDPVLRLETPKGDELVVAPRGGVFVPKVRVGQAVAAGEVVGEVCLVSGPPADDAVVSILGPALSGVAIAGALLDASTAVVVVLGTLVFAGGLALIQARRRRASRPRTAGARALAALSASEGRPLLPASVEPGAPPALATLPSSSRALAEQAAKAPLSPTQLAQLAFHPSTRVAAAATARLAEAGHPDALPALWGLTRRREVDVRAAAYRAIGELGDPASLVQLALDRARGGHTGAAVLAEAARAHLAARLGGEAEWAERAAKAKAASLRLQKAPGRFEGAKRALRLAGIASAATAVVLVPFAVFLVGMDLGTALMGTVLLCVGFAGLPAFAYGLASATTSSLRRAYDERLVLASKKVDRSAGTLSVSTDEAAGALSGAEVQGKLLDGGPEAPPNA